MAQLYGLNIFLAETSATSSGLDSLFDPVGPIKLAEEYAARAFGAKRTLFVTNGTSTAAPMSAISTPIRSMTSRCTGIEIAVPGQTKALLNER